MAFIVRPTAFRNVGDEVQTAFGTFIVCETTVLMPSGQSIKVKVLKPKGPPFGIPG